MQNESSILHDVSSQHAPNLDPAYTLNYHMFTHLKLPKGVASCNVNIVKKLQTILY